MSAEPTVMVSSRPSVSLPSMSSLLESLKQDEPPPAPLAGAPVSPSKQPLPSPQPSFPIAIPPPSTSPNRSYAHGPSSPPSSDANRGRQSSRPSVDQSTDSDVADAWLSNPASLAARHSHPPPTILRRRTNSLSMHQYPAPVFRTSFPTARSQEPPTFGWVHPFDADRTPTREVPRPDLLNGGGKVADAGPFAYFPPPESRRTSLVGPVSSPVRSRRMDPLARPDPAASWEEYRANHRPRTASSATDSSASSRSRESSPYFDSRRSSDTSELFSQSYSGGSMSFEQPLSNWMRPVSAGGPARGPPMPFGVSRNGPEFAIYRHRNSHPEWMPAASSSLPHSPMMSSWQGSHALAARRGSDPVKRVGPMGDDDGADSGRYSCPHCSKRFARPSSLRIHIHSHTGEKPFDCHLCGRGFSVQSNLRRHLKIHRNAEAKSEQEGRTSPHPSADGSGGSGDDN